MTDELIPWQYAKVEIAEVALLRCGGTKNYSKPSLLFGQRSTTLSDTIVHGYTDGKINR